MLTGSHLIELARWVVKGFNLSGFYRFKSGAGMLDGQYDEWTLPAVNDKHPQNRRASSFASLPRKRRIMSCAALLPWIPNRCPNPP